MKRENMKCALQKEIEEDLRLVKEEEMEQVDRLSMLSDHIIVNILSRLTITEAVRTSILSVRWRHLWTYFSGTLDFDGTFDIEESEEDWDSKAEIILEKRDRFISWSYQTLKSLRCPTVEGLRICFSVCNANTCHIVDDWVQFAIEKKVKKLELDFLNAYLSENGFEPCIIPSLLNYTSFRSLLVLRLSYVDVSGELLEYFLSSCPFLETLAVVCSRCIVSLKVSNPSSLKQLDITRCRNLKSLEISAENLVSFTYVGDDISISYKHIPNLREVSFRGPLAEHVLRGFFCLSTYDHSQLKVLKLEITTYQNNFQLPENFILANLLHLELFKKSLVESDLLCFYVSLMNICPSLCTLTLKKGRNESSLETSEKFGMKHPYPCLKEVKLVGFSGDRVEVEFVIYIVENANNLRKLLIDPIRPMFFGLPIEQKITETEDLALARARARDIGANIPPSVEFVIL